MFSNPTGLAVQARGCVLDAPLGAPALRITLCVRDDEETMVFYSSVFHKKMRDHMHFIPLDLNKCAMLVVIPIYIHKCALLIINFLF